MPDQLLDGPLMTIAPDGYVPRKIQLDKVKGSNPSLVRPEIEEKPDTPTSRSNGFITRNLSRFNIMLGIGVGAIGGAEMGEGIATGNTNKIITGAITAGFATVGMGVSAVILRRSS